MDAILDSFLATKKGKQMSKQLLYDHAYEMLSTTNVFPQPPEQLMYHGRYGDDDTVTLLELIRSRPEIGSKKMRSAVRNGNLINNKTCFDAIADAMVSFAKSYPAPASFKKRMRENFIRWLEKILSQYEFSEQPEIPWSLYTEDVENDTVVGLLLALQSRRGATKKELSERLGISDRAVMKDLYKLDPGLRKKDRHESAPALNADISEDSREETPFYLGGQPVRAEIHDWKPQGEREKRYRTEDSIHPLILQENLYQVATLLQALQRNYNEHESSVSSYIALDIWSQLSDYAKERIEYVFTAGDPDFGGFIEILNDETPDEKKSASFRTERQVFNETTTHRDQLMLCAKAERLCTKLYLKIDGHKIELSNVRIRFGNTQGFRGADGELYTARSECGDEVTFRVDDVLAVEIPER